MRPVLAGPRLTDVRHDARDDVRHGRIGDVYDPHLSRRKGKFYRLTDWMTDAFKKASFSCLFMDCHIESWIFVLSEQTTAWPKKVSHYQVSSLNRIKNRH